MISINDLELAFTQEADKCGKCGNSPAWLYTWAVSDDLKQIVSRTACDAHIADAKLNALGELNKKTVATEA
jgi:hypothetical protein